MANPQTNNGYTRIANELLGQIMKTNLNGTQFRIVIAIWRYTYGFRRKQHEMSIRFLAELIDAGKGQVQRELEALIDRQIVNVIEIGSKGARVLQVNKNYEDWKEKEPGVSQTPLLPKIEKKTKQKKNKYSEDNTYYKMATYFYRRVQKVAEEAGIKHLTTKSNMQTWSDDMRKLVEVDDVDKQLVKDVMDWVTQDSFWKTNVLSASKLRKQFPQLAIKMNEQKKTKQPVKHRDHRDKEIEFQQWISEGNDPDEFNWNS